jgi:hypothetical protein
VIWKGFCRQKPKKKPRPAKKCDWSWQLVQQAMRIHEASPTYRMSDWPHPLLTIQNHSRKQIVSCPKKLHPPKKNEN